MIRRLIVVGAGILLTVPSSAAAADGCFVESAQPARCSAESVACSTDNQTNFESFGFTVGTLCAELDDSARSLQHCQANNEGLLAQNRAIAAESSRRVELLRRELRRACRSLKNNRRGRCTGKARKLTSP